MGLNGEELGVSGTIKEIGIGIIFAILALFLVAGAPQLTYFILNLFFDSSF